VRLVDSHAHLQVPRFAHDADAVLAAAQQAGVERLLDPGWDLASSEAALGLARRYPWIDAAAGVHPHDATALDDGAWSAIVELAADPGVVAIGETGLDYDRLFSPGEVQLAGLRRHLELALALGKPLILHCRSARAERDAQDDLLRELRDAGFGGHDWRDRFRGRVPAVLHSFSGPIDYAEEALALGLAISISGLAFRRREESTAEVARLVPADRLLVETDSPYLPPPGADRRRNEPRWVGITAAWLAEQRSEDPGLLGERLVANYDRVFRAS
jgi:TatD DNase family protein